VNVLFSLNPNVGLSVNFKWSKLNENQLKTKAAKDPSMRVAANISCFVTGIFKMTMVPNHSKEIQLK